MSYSTKIMDITKAETDVIVNSLGVQGNTYGKLCKSIIAAAKSEKIKNFIDSLYNNNIGDIFITDSGNLSCKKIFHIVTPFKRDDNEFNHNLKKAYLDVINKAIDLGYKSIGLPLIGTGANGYSENEVFNALTEVCGKFSVQEQIEDRDIIDITIYVVLKSKPVEARYLNNRSRYYNYSNESIDDLENKSKRKIIIDFYKCIDAMKKFDSSKFIDLKNNDYECPFNFIYDYYKAMGRSDHELNGESLDRKRKYNLSIKKRLEKKEVYALAYMAKMSFSNLIQFMIICGLSFSPNELDIFIIDNYEKLISNNVHFIEFNLECMRIAHVDLSERIYGKKD